MRRDPRYQFKLSQNEMDALFGEDQNAPKNVESLELSKNEGMWDDARKAYQSPLENMVPEVQVGNQTALNSRKHPFARYIAAMHRGIHEAWAYGYLQSLDGHPNSHPLNNLDLWTKVEIVLNNDGTIDKVRTVHHSGNSSFDAAAREIVFATGPYPNPPRSIRSGNGKIYMHWAFHRNERACGTFGAQPYILNNAGAGDIPNAHAEVHLHGGGSSQPHEEVRALTRNDGSNNVVGGAEQGQTEQLRRGGQGQGLSATPEGPSRPPPKPADPVAAGGVPAPGGPGGPVVSPNGRGPGGFGSGGAGSPGQGTPGAGASGMGKGNVGADGVPTGRGAGAGAGALPPSSQGLSLSGRRNAGAAGNAGAGAGKAGSGPGKAGTAGTGTGTGSGTAGAGKAETEEPATPEGPVDPAATAVAKNWARAFAKGEITTMVNRTALPFHSGSKVAAKSKEELRGLLEAMSEEVAGKTATVKGSHSAASLRKKFGSVPAGVEEGEGRVYTVVEIGGDTVILMLEKRYGSWRIIGLTR